MFNTFIETTTIFTYFLLKTLPTSCFTYLNFLSSFSFRIAADDSRENTKPQRKAGRAPGRKHLKRDTLLLRVGFRDYFYNLKLLNDQDIPKRRGGKAERSRRKSDKNKELCEGGFPARRGAQLPGASLPTGSPSL